MHHFQLHAPAGNHIGGNGAVQTAGEQAHRPAAHADGQAAGAGDRGRVDIGVLLPDLHINRQIRMVHIRFHVEELPQLAAYILGDLDGVHGELLVCPAALHLEGSGLGKFIRQIGLGGLHNGVHLLGARDGAGHRHDAEHLTGSLEGGLHVAVLGLRLHIDSALANVDLEAAAGLHPAADIAHQLILKAAAVQALQHHLAQLQKQDLVVVHNQSSVRVHKAHIGYHIFLLSERGGYGFSLFFRRNFCRFSPQI